jgi:pimeloyl-ACP methyl ester carboxylesterase
LGFAKVLYNDPVEYHYKPPEPVIFLPGILGSKLDKASDNSEVWPGNLLSSRSDAHLNFLSLDNFGKEITGKEIKIKEVLSESAFNYNVYKNILDRLTLFAASFGALFSPNPYDWRMDIKDSASKLAQNIQSAAAQSPTGKVNLVAHSMGGLVVKEYLRQVAGTRNIDKVIFMGTPNLGAPKAGKILLYGDDLNISIFGAVGLNPAEAKIISALKWGYADQHATKVSSSKYSSDTYPVIGEVDTDGVKKIADKILYIESARVLGNSKLNGVINLD